MEIHRAVREAVGPMVLMSDLIGEYNLTRPSLLHATCKAWAIWLVLPRSPPLWVAVTIGISLGLALAPPDILSGQRQSPEPR